MPAALFHLRGRRQARPQGRGTEGRQGLLVVGQRLLNEKKPEQALVLFKLDAEENPYSFRAYFAVGAAYLESGNKEQAVKNLERAYAMNPKSYDVAETLKQARQ